MGRARRVLGQEALVGLFGPFARLPYVAKVRVLAFSALVLCCIARCTPLGGPLRVHDVFHQPLVLADAPLLETRLLDVSIGPCKGGGLDLCLDEVLHLARECFEIVGCLLVVRDALEGRENVHEKVGGDRRIELCRHRWKPFEDGTDALWT